MLGTLAFLAVSLTIGRRAVFFVIRWVNDTFVSEFAVITAILLIMGAMALITDAIGVHTVLGAFVAGVLIGESPILTRHIDEQLRGLITAFFAPVFFGIAGLTADLTHPRQSADRRSHRRADPDRQPRQVRRRPSSAANSAASTRAKASRSPAA